MYQQYPQHSTAQNSTALLKQANGPRRLMTWNGLPLTNVCYLCLLHLTREQLFSFWRWRSSFLHPLRGNQLDLIISITLHTFERPIILRNCEIILGRQQQAIGAFTWEITESKNLAHLEIGGRRMKGYLQM